MNDLEISNMNEKDLEKTFELAFGRILRMGSRKTQEGDVEEYERCKSIIMEIKERLERF